MRGRVNSLYVPASISNLVNPVRIISLPHHLILICIIKILNVFIVPLLRNWSRRISTSGRY